MCYSRPRSWRIGAAELREWSMHVVKQTSQNLSLIKMQHSYGSHSNAQPYNHTTSPYNHATKQVHHTTSKGMAKDKRQKKFLSVIGKNGSNLKALMDSMNLRNRSSFMNTYIAPNLAEGYIAMLYPESPNHPMQSYYLTNKGRELLKQL